MIARTSRVFFEVVAATLVGLVLLVAVAAWRLSQGPLSLTFLTPAIEEALKVAREAGCRIAIDLADPFAVDEDVTARQGADHRINGDDAGAFDELSSGHLLAFLPMVLAM